MPGLDREIDPRTGDYISDPATGTTKKVRNALPAVYHQIRTKLGSWFGDPTAGSRFFELDRAKSTLQTPNVITDIMIAAMQPLVDVNVVTVPITVVDRDVDRVEFETTVEDLQSGESIDLTDFISLNP